MNHINQQLSEHSIIIQEGNIHDSQCLESLLKEDEGEAYANSAYKSKKHDTLLEKQNSKNGLMCKANRNRPLNLEKQNKIISSICYVAEKTFGILELRCHMGKAKYNGLARTTVSIGLMST